MASPCPHDGTTIDLAGIEWAGMENVRFTHGVVYGPRVLPVWIRVDGEWELQDQQVRQVITYG